MANLFFVKPASYVTWSLYMSRSHFIFALHKMHRMDPRFDKAFLRVKGYGHLYFVAGYLKMKSELNCWDKIVGRKLPTTFYRKQKNAVC